jgi:hypothetical protein
MSENKNCNCSRNQGREDRGEHCRGEFKYDIFDAM